MYNSTDFVKNSNFGCKHLGTKIGRFIRIKITKNQSVHINLDHSGITPTFLNHMFFEIAKRHSFKMMRSKLTITGPKYVIPLVITSAEHVFKEKLHA